MTECKCMTLTWELVRMDAERPEIFSGFGKWLMEPIVYRTTFKRAADAA